MTHMLATAIPTAARWPTGSRPNRSSFVIPAGAGAGADLMARALLWHGREAQPDEAADGGGEQVKVAPAAEGFLYVKDSKGDPHKIIITLSNLFTTPLATGIPFNWKDLTPVAMLALDEFVLWVNADAPYKSAKDYLAKR